MCKKGVIMNVSLDSAPRHPFDEESCRCWFRDMILGIEYLHEQGIVHRDIKPDNLLLTENDVLKIGDFGVSEMFEKRNDRLAKGMVGSPAFSAPEVVTLQKRDISGKATDIWAMGITLFCLIFGRLPFVTINIMELYEMIRDLDPQYPDDIDPTLLDLFEKMLKKDPQERIRMSELREHPWVTANGEDPLLPTSENVPERDASNVTKEDIRQAIKGIRGVMTVVRAVNKLKQLSKTRHMSHPHTHSPPPDSPGFVHDAVPAESYPTSSAPTSRSSTMSTSNVQLQLNDLHINDSELPHHQPVSLPRPSDFVDLHINTDVGPFVSDATLVVASPAHTNELMYEHAVQEDEQRWKDLNKTHFTNWRLETWRGQPVSNESGRQKLEMPPLRRDAIPLWEDIIVNKWEQHREMADALFRDAMFRLERNLHKMRSHDGRKELKQKGRQVGWDLWDHGMTRLNEYQDKHQKEDRQPVKQDQTKGDDGQQSSFLSEVTETGNYLVDKGITKLQKIDEHHKKKHQSKGEKVLHVAQKAFKSGF